MCFKVHMWLVLWNVHGNVGERCEHVFQYKCSHLLLHLHYVHETTFRIKMS